MRIQIIDTSSGSVVGEIEAGRMETLGQIVTFYKNSYGTDVCGVTVLTPGLAILEKKEDK